MEFANELKDKIDYFLEGNYEEKDIDFIPIKEAISIRKKVYKTQLCSFCIDLRGSTKILKDMHKQDAIKIHKSFLGIATKTVLEYGGKIRDYQGDCLLAFWSITNNNLKNQLSSAVKAAMGIRWFLTSDYLSEFFSRYPNLDFGVGIDYGKVHIIRVGLTDKSEYNDLVFLGDCVNFSVAIANNLKLPDNIGISNSVYENIEGKARYYSKDDSDKWKEGTIDYKGGMEPIKVTHWNLIQK